MDGTANPPGRSNINAEIRNQLILKWDKNSVTSETNDIIIQSLILTDIASGFSFHSPTFNISSNIYNKTEKINKYDISCNVFQFKFYAFKEVHLIK